MQLMRIGKQKSESEELRDKSQENEEKQESGDREQETVKTKP